MPKPPPSLDQIRDHLRELIEAQYGGFDGRVVSQLCRVAGIQRTTLAGYFGLLKNRRQTNCLQDATLRKVLLAIGEDPIEFLRGVQDRQLELWPVAFKADPATIRVDGADQLHRFAELMESSPAAARIRACRMSISAGVDALASAGESVPDQAYDLLRELDGLTRELRQLRLLA